MVNNQKLEKKTPLNGWRLNKLWYIYTTEYYSEIQRNKLVIHTTTWMKIKGTKKRSQYTKRLHTVLFPSILHSWNDKMQYLENDKILAKEIGWWLPEDNDGGGGWLYGND